MLQHCYYYNELTGTSRRIDIKEMLNRAEKNDEVFRSMKQSLFRTDDHRIPMVLVKAGAHKGFRRKGRIVENNGFTARGENESFSHQGNKAVFSAMKEFDISFNNQRVRLYIDYAETEKMVVCNNSRYEVDVYYRLIKTNPAEYYDIWNGELFVELFHTNEVTYKQAEDFSIEKKALFEYKIPEDAEFYDEISEEGYNKWVNALIHRNKKKGVDGFLVSGRDKEHYCWRNSKQGNLTFRADGMYFTVLENKYGPGYVISLGKGKTKKSYNGKPFMTLDDAVKVAEYFAFLIFNDQGLCEIAKQK